MQKTNRGAKVMMVAVAPNMSQMTMRRVMMPMRFLEKKRSRSQLYICQRKRKFVPRTRRTEKLASITKLHALGRISHFHQLKKDKYNNEDPSPIEFFKETHTNKKTGCMSSTALED